MSNRIGPSGQQIAEYTYDMLTALKELATARGQDTLAVLLSAAADEARSLAKPALANGQSADKS